MYTESYAGDIDEILERESVLATLCVTLPTTRGRVDQYGFTREQREAIGPALLNIGRALMKNAFGGIHKPATIQIDAQRKIVLRNWAQTANLYQTLTRNDWYAGLEGERAKPKIKRFVF